MNTRKQEEELFVEYMEGFKQDKIIVKSSIGETFWIVFQNN